MTMIVNGKDMIKPIKCNSHTHIISERYLVSDTEKYGAEFSRVNYSQGGSDLTQQTALLL